MINYIKVSSACVCTLLVAAQPAPSLPMSTVPFRLVQSGGATRPLVTVYFNDHPFNMMLHSQASFRDGEIQLRHDQVAKFGAENVRITGKYGIDRPGHLSDKGSGTTSIDTVRIGRTSYSNVPISVFEVPQTDMGMIGIGWLRRHRAMVDFSAQRLTVEPTRAFSQRVRLRLIRAGYRAIPMTIRGGFYNVRVTLGGATRHVSIATATPSVLDARFAKAAGVTSSSEGTEGFGPTGNSTQVGQATDPVVFMIGNWRSPKIAAPMIMDIQSYEASKRGTSEDDFGGSLGESFLTATRAVVDFGEGILYVAGSSQGRVRR